MGARARLRDLARSSRPGSRASGSSARSAATACARWRSPPASARPRRRAPTRRSRSPSRCSRRARRRRSALAFQFASTNLVIELGVVMWVLIGWQFTLAVFVGGLVLIVLMMVLLRLFVSRRLEAQAREHARAGRRRPRARAPASTQLTWRERLASVDAWTDVAQNFRNDWSMLWKEIAIGFLLAGFIGRWATASSTGCSSSTRPAVLKLAENVIVGPIIAVLSFVCSIGNVPLAAVLWSGGISFAGVIAFLFADLIVIPIVADLPQVLRRALHAPDRRADVRDDGAGGAGRRRPVQRAGPDPRVGHRARTSSARSRSTTSCS